MLLGWVQGASVWAWGLRRHRIGSFWWVLVLRGPEMVATEEEMGVGTGPGSWGAIQGRDV